MFTNRNHNSIITLNPMVDIEIRWPTEIVNDVVSLSLSQWNATPSVSI